MRPSLYTYITNKVVQAQYILLLLHFIILLKLYNIYIYSTVLLIISLYYLVIIRLLVVVLASLYKCKCNVTSFQRYLC